MPRIQGGQVRGSVTTRVFVPQPIVLSTKGTPLATAPPLSLFYTACGPASALRHRTGWRLTAAGSRRQQLLSGFPLRQDQLGAPRTAPRGCCLAGSAPDRQLQLRFAAGNSWEQSSFQQLGVSSSQGKRRTALLLPASLRQLREWLRARSNHRAQKHGAERDLPGAAKPHDCW